MATDAPPNLQAVSVDYEYSRNLPALIEELQLSIVVNSYQPGGRWPAASSPKRRMSSLYCIRTP